MRRATAALAVLVACGGMKDPGSVADKFVDRYYVESDQQGALAESRQPPVVPVQTGHR